jgi:exopolysaccharide production protein ExoQ
MSTASLALQGCDGHQRHWVNLARVAGLFLGIRVCITLLLFRNEPALGTAVALATSFALLLASVGHWLVLAPSYRSHHHTPSPVKWLAIYLALALASLSWSSTPSLAIALAYWSGMAADVLTVLFLISSSEGNDMLNALLRGFILGAVSVAVLAWCLPTMQDLRLGDEDLLHPNAIGFEFAIAVLCSIYLAAQAAWAKSAGVFLAITLLRTLSKASIVAFLAAAGYWFVKDTDISSRAKAKIGLALGTVLIFSWGLLEAYAEVYSQGSQSETLTGRTLIWATSFDIAIERPWLGHGFYSFRWLVPPLHDFQPWQAHNELLQQFFCYGALGVIVTIALYWALFRQTRSSSDHKLTRLATALLIFALVRGLVDTERFDLSFPLWLVAAASISMAKTKSSRVTL